MKPNIFNYHDARSYIADEIHYLKSIGRYSTRSFAKEAGFGSPDYVRRILSGERRLSQQISAKLVKGFQLSGVSENFFKKLVDLTEAKSEAEKLVIWDQLNQIRKKKQVRQISFEQYRFYHNWKIGLIYEGLKSFWAQASAAQIAMALQITEAEVEDHLKCLKEMGLLSGAGSQWQVSDSLLQTDSETDSQMIRGFHKMMLKKVLSMLDELPTKDRKVFNVSLSLSDKQYSELSEEIFDFLTKLNIKYGQNRNVDGVFNLSLQFFPLYQVDSAEASHRPASLNAS
jgi:uncharacterized protein (TIGR02147 family)